MRWTKLPRKGHWEVEALAGALHELRALVFVVDASSHAVHAAESILVGGRFEEEVAGVVLRAAAAIGQRPRTLRCRSPLRSALERAAKALGASLQVTEALPAADQATAALVDLDAEPPDLLPEHAEPWREAVDELVDESPWRWLPDDLRFRFAGVRELAGAVAIVIGQAGEQRGVSVFPTQADYDAFLRDIYGGGEPTRRWSCWCAHFDPTAEVRPDQIQRAREAGLVRDDFVLQLYGIEAGAPRFLDTVEERSCLVAVQGVLGAWRRHGHDLLGPDKQTAVETDAGPVQVTTGFSLPVPREERILEVDHLVAITRVRREDGERPALVMKMAKRDAQRLRARLSGVDALSIERPSTGDVDVVAWAGDRRIGPVCHLDDVPAVEALKGEVALVISGGGARRTGLRESDILDVLAVEVREA